MKTKFILLGAVLLLSLAAAGCRDDMHNQPKYKPLRVSDFFGDRRSARPAIEDTVSRGHLKIDSARYTGKVNNQEVDYFPWKMTRADLQLGEFRFNIYCSPCHSRLGDGNGMIVQRGFRRAASYHTAKLIAAPVGHFFDVISNGYGAMPSYASRIPVDDRWRIIAYVRVLQLSQSAKITDIPEDIRKKMQDDGATAEVRVPNTPTSMIVASPPESVVQSPGHPEYPSPYSGQIPPSVHAMNVSQQEAKAQGAKQ